MNITPGSVGSISDTTSIFRSTTIEQAFDVDASQQGLHPTPSGSTLGPGRTRVSGLVVIIVSIVVVFYGTVGTIIVIMIVIMIVIIIIIIIIIIITIIIIIIMIIIIVVMIMMIIMVMIMMMMMTLPLTGHHDIKGVRDHG